MINNLIFSKKDPIGLLTNIGTGVQDLFEKPYEGFTQGPLEGGIGVVKGAGSLIQNTVKGVFNTVDKITGSVGSGIAALSLVLISKIILKPCFQ